MIKKLLLPAMVTGFSFFLWPSAFAQSPDPTVSNGRPNPYLSAITIYANDLGTGGANVDGLNANSPTGLAGGGTTGPNGLSRFNFDNGQTSFFIRGDYQNNSSSTFNTTLADGTGAANIHRFFLYQYSGDMTFTPKSSTTITIADGAKSITNTANGGGVAYPDTYIGAGANSPSTMRYLFNANNLVLNKVNGLNGTTVVPNTLIYINQTNIEVIGAMTFTSGRLLMGANDTVIIASTGTIGAGNANSYVDGKISNRNITASNVVFPLGDYGIYAPATMGGVGTTGTTLQYLADGTTTNTSSLGAGVATVSKIEHYNVTSTALANTVITLPYNPANRSNYIADPTKLILAGYDGTQWVNMGTSTTSGGNLVTTLTRSLSGIQQIAVGSSSAVNVLPITYISFTAIKSADAASSILNWYVADNAKDATAFTVQRSADGNSFTNIGTVAVTGTEGGTFAFTDASPLNGQNLYRIRGVEKDGAYTYTAVRQLYYGAVTNNISVAPNPARGYTQVIFGGTPNYGQVGIKLVDGAGRTVQAQQSAAVTGSKVMVNTSTIAPGRYQVQVTDAKGNTVYSGAIIKL